MTLSEAPLKSSTPSVALGRAAAGLLPSVHGIATLGVRLTGVGAAGLVPVDDNEFTFANAAGQLSLLEPSAEQKAEMEARMQRSRGERLGHTLDTIRDRFGAAVIGRPLGTKAE